MSLATLEHINLTVPDAKATAERLCSLFEWKVRWHGPALNGEGHTYHVGNENQYLAVYEPGAGIKSGSHSTYLQSGGLNHIGLVVDDIVSMEAKIREAGYTPVNHADYEPGKRFYFHDEDGIEIEIVSYSG